MNTNLMTVDMASKPTETRCEIDSTRAAGFTMVELLVTIAIASILLTLAVPSFRYVTNSNRIAGELNGLVGDLQFARAEAVKEGRTVTVCASADGNTCSNAITWQSGWIVFSDPTNVGVHDPGETIFRVQAAFSSTDTYVASNGVSAITFNRDGYAIGIPNGSLITLHDSTDTNAWTRCLSINLSGEMTTEIFGTTTNGSTCT
jgi:type IV fimbrial biogenesis protein FimT